MITDPPPAPASPVRWPGTAAALGGALLAGVALVLGLVAVDHARRPALETFSESTAAGDRAVVPKPGRRDLGSPVVTIRGRPFYAVSRKEVEARDSRMHRAGFDDSGAHRLYTAADPLPLLPGEGEAAGEPAFYLKLGPGEFLKVRPTPSAPPAPAGAAPAAE